MKFLRSDLPNEENFVQREAILVPVRRWFEFDLNCLFVCIDIVPLAVRVPAFSYDLDQNFPLGNLRNLRGTVLVGLEIQFSELIFMEEAARFVESDIDASVCNRFSVGAAYYFDPQLDRARVGRLFILLILIGLVGRGLLGRSGGLVLGGRLVFRRRLVLSRRLRECGAGKAEKCCEQGEREETGQRFPAAQGGPHDSFFYRINRSLSSSKKTVIHNGFDGPEMDFSLRLWSLDCSDV